MSLLARGDTRRPCYKEAWEVDTFFLRTSGEVLADGGEEFGGVDGFGDESHPQPAAREGFAVGLHGAGGERDDGGGDFLPAEFAGGGVAVEVGHLDVHEDEVEGGLGEGCGEGFVDGGPAIVDEGDGGFGAVEEVDDEGLVVGAVFGDEDAGMDGRVGVVGGGGGGNGGGEGVEWFGS